MAKVKKVRVKRSKFEYIKKEYDPKSNLFLVRKETRKYPKESFYEQYENFDDFYNACEQDLTDAVLFQYDFAGVDLTKYDFKNASLSSKISIELGRYDDSLHKSLMSNYLDVTPSKYEVLTLENNNQLVEYDEIDDKMVSICYISDMHINHKIAQKFPNYVTEGELNLYLQNINDQLGKSVKEGYGYPYLFFLGDTSFNFEVFKRFVKHDGFNFSGANKFVILGNHELWDPYVANTFGTYENIVEAYRTMLKKEFYTLLENDVYVPRSKKGLYHYDEIMNMDSEGIKKLFKFTSYGFMGGMGFAGLNECFNAKYGIYGMTKITREQEINYSLKLSSLHRKLREAIPDKTLYVMTHMPVQDWLSDTIQPNWYYVNGHTHKNFKIFTDKYKVFADNQLGYKNDNFSFKYIMQTAKEDLFKNYEDGIHEITRKQYKQFYSCICVNFQFYREFKKLYFLKKNGYYCFLMITMNDTLCMLNGGASRNIGDNSIESVYENLDNYGNSIKLFMSDYSKKQKEIANFIKSIGGNGFIHGCIIDIDYYNHIYFNPLDEKITAYYATDIVSKYVYTNLASLLYCKCKYLYSRFEKIMNESDGMLPAVINEDCNISTKVDTYCETDIYKVSRIIKGLQYTTTNNIVRIWNDEIAKKPSLEIGNSIIEELIYPKKIKYAKKPKLIEVKKIKPVAKGKVKKSLSKKEDKFEKYRDKINKITNGNIEVIAYTGSRDKTIYKCKNCGHQWSIRSDKFKDRNHYKCPKCKK